MQKPKLGTDGLEVSALGLVDRADPGHDEGAPARGERWRRGDRAERRRPRRDRRGTPRGARAPLQRGKSEDGGPMKITRSSIDTQKGPAEWFTGDVYIDQVASPPEMSRAAAALVHFTPGARTVWHTHPLGQTIFVTEGVGLCQREGGAIEVIRPGDRVFLEPGENNCHGAAPNRFMVLIALHNVDD